MPKVKWLSRELVRGPYLVLCRSEEEFLAVMKRMKVKSPPPWLGASADAMVHHFELGSHLTCVVTIRDDEHASPGAINGLLVHEAVHCFQVWCRHAGESKPGDEFMAYAIQSIAQELMDDFARKR